MHLVWVIIVEGEDQRPETKDEWRWWKQYYCERCQHRDENLVPRWSIAVKHSKQTIKLIPSFSSIRVESLPKIFVNCESVAWNNYSRQTRSRVEWSQREFRFRDTSKTARSKLDLISRAAFIVVLPNVSLFYETICWRGGGRGVVLHVILTCYETKKFSVLE